MQSLGDILIIDNEPTIVDFIAEALTDEGYTVRIALHPEDACATITVRHPDLVLLDLRLPGTSGDVLARDFKNNGLADVPIVIMTADAQKARELSMEGIEYCLAKPFDIDDLIVCVAKYIRRSGAAA